MFWRISEICLAKPKASIICWRKTGFCWLIWWIISIKKSLVLVSVRNIKKWSFRIWKNSNQIMKWFSLTIKSLFRSKIWNHSWLVNKSRNFYLKNNKLRISKKPNPINPTNPNSISRTSIWKKSKNSTNSKNSKKTHPQTKNRTPTLPTNLNKIELNNKIKQIKN